MYDTTEVIPMFSFPVEIRNNINHEDLGVLRPFNIIYHMSYQNHGIVIIKGPVQ